MATLILCSLIAFVKILYVQNRVVLPFYWIQYGVDSHLLCSKIAFVNIRSVFCEHGVSSLLSFFDGISTVVCNLNLYNIIVQLTLNIYFTHSNSFYFFFLREKGCIILKNNFTHMR